MNYSILTQYSLERAKESRDKLKEAQRKQELYNLYRNENDLERKFYNHLEVPIRKFLYKFSIFNFMNFKRLDKYSYKLFCPEQKTNNSKFKNNLVNGILTTSLGISSLLCAYLMGSNSLENFNKLETINKIDILGLEALLLTSAIALTNQGIRKILKNKYI